MANISAPTPCAASLDKVEPAGNHAGLGPVPDVRSGIWPNVKEAQTWPVMDPGAGQTGHKKGTRKTGPPRQG
jgi:hypothetical protein